MRIVVVRLLALICVCLINCGLLNAQVNSGSTVAGTIKDPNGAVIAGATINVKSATGPEFNVTTSDNGTFTISDVPPGTYVVTIKSPGFKIAIIKDVIVEAGKPATVQAVLEVGNVLDYPSPDPGGWGDEIFYSATPTVIVTHSGRGISELSLESRHALDLVPLETGVTTVGRPRQSTINGLPKGAINITLDGINIQDNFARSGDGFFPFIQPRIDAVEEMTVTTAVPDVTKNGDGAGHIDFVTRSGTNSFSESLFEYLRNSALNANNYFNGINGFPRPELTLNQFGGRLGGPIVRDHAFFFVDYEEYRLPEAVHRQRTIFAPAVLSGLFTYAGNFGSRSVNLFNLAAANNQTSTIDPTIGSLLAQIQASTVKGAVVSSVDPDLQNFAFFNKGMQLRKFPSVRFDGFIANRLKLENEYSYQQFDSPFDFSSFADPAFPGFPNFGSQRSNRFVNSTAFRATLTNTIINEIRFGFTGGNLRLFPEITPAQFSNQGGFSLNLGSAGISSATGQNALQKRNSPLWQINDNFAWAHQNHFFAFGFTFTQINLYNETNIQVVPGINFGLDVSDPAQSLFNTINFPGASFSQLNQAENIYALLTGRITSVTGSAAINEDGNGYTNFRPFTERDRQRDTGIYAMDSWRATPTLTLVGGLRWEIQFPMTPLNSAYAQTAFDQLFGLSGPGNLFKPGTLSGTPTLFTPVQPGTHPYNTDFGDLAPSLGFAWNPSPKKRIAKKMLGDLRTAIRGGYSIAFVREGTAVISSILGDNPGARINTSVSSFQGDFSSPALLRNGAPSLLTPVPPVFPLTGNLSTSANVFLPDLKTGRVHSFSFGIQREFNYRNVIEIRYVGNRAMDMWRQYNINEINILENGFLNEFKLAQANLAANNAAGRSNSFAFFGPGTNTAPLPTILGFFSGVPAAQANDPTKYTSTLFRSFAFINQLNPVLPNVQSFASLLRNSAAFASNVANAGIPDNLFVVNPQVAGAFLVDNSNRSYYDAAQIEFRRRLSRGLMVDASYVFSKSLSNYYSDNSSVFKNFVSLHNRNLDHAISPFDITHTFKTRFIYDLPVGEYRRFFDSKNPVLSRLANGWTVAGTIRIQSGSPFSLGNVQLVGMTRQDLQNSISIRKDANDRVFYLPPDIIQGTINAFNGIPGSGRFIAPANLNNPLPFAGATGFANLVLHGPRFTRFDLAVVKRTKITDRINFEFRAEFLNAFNNINFMVTNPATDAATVGGLSSASFGQTIFNYQDPVVTNDPGGRMIQFGLRLNF